MSARRPVGRDVTRLLADFGHDLPTTANPARLPKEPRLLPNYLRERLDEFEVDQSFKGGDMFVAAGVRPLESATEA